MRRKGLYISFVLRRQGAELADVVVQFDGNWIDFIVAAADVVHHYAPVPESGECLLYRYGWDAGAGEEAEVVDAPCAVWPDVFRNDIAVIWRSGSLHNRCGRHSFKKQQRQTQQEPEKHRNLGRQSNVKKQRNVIVLHSGQLHLVLSLVICHA